MSHFLKKCRGCGIVLGQCRCPSPNKTVEWGECTDREACLRRYPRAEPALLGTFELPHDIQTIRSLHAQVAQLTAERDAARLERDQLRNRLHEVNGERDVLKSNFAAADASQEHWETRARRAETERDALRDEVQEQSRKAMDRGNKLTELRSDNERLRGANNILDDTVGSLGAENDRLQRAAVPGNGPEMLRMQVALKAEQELRQRRELDHVAETDRLRADWDEALNALKVRSQQCDVLRAELAAKKPIEVVAYDKQAMDKCAELRCQLRELREAAEAVKLSWDERIESPATVEHAMEALAAVLAKGST